ncbi:MAG TPA: bacterial transcriptional activator domain-containing protein, partial [Ktedonobacterales bacterium]|nr:bacterial transcriptional activator domain-containing protein [Ktedonobacterales bacterium]
ARLRVSVMGETRVFCGDEEITSWARPGMRELLVYLLDHETPARRDEILADIWPEKEPRLAGEEFRKVRSELKKALGVQVKKLDDGRYTVAEVESYDARDFEAAAQLGEALMRAGDTPEAIVALRRAVSLGAGSFLSEVYSEWVVLRRDALRREYLIALEQLVEAQMILKEYAALTRSAYLLLDANPLCEKAHRALMVGFYACGEPARALDQFRQCARILREELELEPTPRTVALYKTIRSRVGAGRQNSQTSSRAASARLV